MRLRSRPAARLALLCAATVLSSSCGSWDLDPSVLVKPVALDLAFGRDLSATPAPAPTPPPPLAVEEEEQSPILNRFNTFREFVAPELCPEARITEVFPERPLANSTTSMDDPEEGLYRFEILDGEIETVQGTLDLGLVRTVAGGRLVQPRLISQKKTEITPLPGFSYGVADPLRFSEIRYLVVRPDDSELQPGFYFQQWSFLTNRVQQPVVVVRPSQPLLLMPFPIQQGYTTDARVQQVEVGFEENPSLGPGCQSTPQNESTCFARPTYELGDAIVSAPGQGGAATSGTAMTSSATVEQRTNDNRVYGCGLKTPEHPFGHAVDAHRVTWRLEITGQVEETIEGTFWFAPQYGGMPFREEVSYSGTALESVGINAIDLVEEFMYLDSQG